MPTELKPPDPPLTDGVVTVRVADETRDSVGAAAPPDAEIARWIFGESPEEPPDPAEQFAHYRELWRAGTAASFSVDAVGHEQRVGVAGVLLGLVDPFRLAEVGYIFQPHGRGHGYATRTVRLLARWVFDDLGLARLQARTHPDNIASQRVLERVGFQREGLARAANQYLLSGERHDCVMWSLLPGEMR